MILNQVYRHTYGGYATDVEITREQFARFFDQPVENIDTWPTNQKVMNQFYDGVEVLGYIVENRPGEKSYQVTFIRKGN